MTGTAVSTIDQNIPARLRTPEAAARIAAANAAAAGGVKAGGFPRISLKANKFHVISGGQTTTLMGPPAAPGQPPIPMQVLTVVVIGANPALSKTYYAGEYVEGSVEEPDCRSGNGVTPDVGVTSPQNSVCATCPQNQWGSAVSKLTHKEIKACSDSKQLAVIPSDDLTYMALGLQIGPGSLQNWGKYISDLIARQISVGDVVTNVSFDLAKTGVLNFSFNRYLTDEEYAAASARGESAEVQTIVAQSRAIAAPVALPAPTQVASPPAAQIAAPAAQQAAQAPADQTQAASGFAAATAATQAPAQTQAAQSPTEPAKRNRAPRKTAAPDPRIAHLSPELQTAVVASGGADSPGGQALLAQFPAPAAAPVEQPAVDPTAHLSAEMKAAVAASGGPTSPGGAAILAAFPVPAAAAAPAPTQAAPAAQAQAAPAQTMGFGAAAPAATAATSTAPAAGAASALRDQLAARLAAQVGK